MRVENKFHRAEFIAKQEDIKRGAKKYVQVFTEIMEKINDFNSLILGQQLVQMGYALGVIAGASSDSGVEGFTLLLNGIKISLMGEDRKEAIQFAIWDKYGGLHTSEEGLIIKKGGEA